MENLFNSLVIANNIQNVSEILQITTPHKAENTITENKSTVALTDNVHVLKTKAILALPAPIIEKVVVPTVNKPQNNSNETSSKTNLSSQEQKPKKKSFNDIYQASVVEAERYVKEKFNNGDTLTTVVLKNNIQINKLDVLDALKRSLGARVNPFFLNEAITHIIDVEVKEDNALVIYSPKDLNGISMAYLNDKLTLSFASKLLGEPSYRIQCLAQ